MPFTYCTYCGEKIDFQYDKCPKCGQARPGVYTAPPNGTPPPPNGGVGGQNGQGYGQEGPQGNYYPPRGENPLYKRPQPGPKKNLNVGLFVFSIINVFIGSCCCVGLMFGIPALYFTSLARNTASDVDEKKCKKIALMLNIGGIITFAVFMIVLMLSLYNNPEFSAYFETFKENM